MSPMPYSNAASADAWSIFLMVTSFSVRPRALSHELRAKWAEETVVQRTVFPSRFRGCRIRSGSSWYSPVGLHDRAVGADHDGALTIASSLQLAMT